MGLISGQSEHIHACCRGREPVSWIASSGLVPRDAQLWIHKLEPEQWRSVGAGAEEQELFSLSIWETLHVRPEPLDVPVSLVVPVVNRVLSQVIDVDVVSSARYQDLDLVGEEH